MHRSNPTLAGSATWRLLRIRFLAFFSLAALMGTPANAQTSSNLPPGAGLDVTLAASDGHNLQEKSAFVVDNSGTLQMVLQVPQFLMTMTPANFAPPGANVAVGRQETQIDVFVVGNDGSLYVLFQLPSGKWSAPAALMDPSFAPPGAHLATANLPDNRLVVFVVDSTGRLQSLEVRDRGDWQEPWSQTFAGFAPPGASITAAYQQSDQLDLFVVDSQGRLRVFCWTVPSIWPLPSWVYTLSEPGSAPPGAHIAAAKQGSNQLDVFLINSQGALHILWVVGGGTWSRADLTVGNFAPPGGHVAARQDDLPELDVSIVANSGQQLYWLSVEGQGAWSQPKVIDQLEHAEPGAAVAFLKDPRTGVRQLFFISSRGLEASDEVRQSRSPKWGFPYRIF